MVYIVAKLTDVKSVRIKCRCGNSFVDRFPKQIMFDEHIVTCSSDEGGCAAHFTVRFCKEHNEYHIRRVEVGTIKMVGEEAGKAN